MQWIPGYGALAACAPDLMVTGSCSSLLPTASQHIVTRYIATLRNDVHDIEPTTFTSSSVIYSQYFDQIHLCIDGNHLWTGASSGWEQHWSLRLNRNIQKAVWQHVPLGKSTVMCSFLWSRFPQPYAFDQVSSIKCVFSPMEWAVDLVERLVSLQIVLSPSQP